jgi:hypothetical protein
MTTTLEINQSPKSAIICPAILRITHSLILLLNIPQKQPAFLATAGLAIRKTQVLHLRYQ